MSRQGHFSALSALSGSIISIFMAQRPQAIEPPEDTAGQPKRLVSATAAKLREMILAREPGVQIGSLTEVSEALGVGIVTVQQAARILEHEGLLDVRRGPGGGYYGARPDEAALERALAAYMRVHGAKLGDGLHMLSLLDYDIAPAAARCTDEALRVELRDLIERIAACDTEESRIAFEDASRDLLFRMEPRPLFDLISRVGKQLFSSTTQTAPLFPGAEGVAAWKDGKRRILDAILERDEALARFEAERYRAEVLRRLADWRSQAKV
jgi:GntR family transcriptional repressor for pyruvate dehydrogenase complex